MPHPKQPVAINPLWFFTKVAVLCALAVIAAMQGHAILQRNEALVSKNAAVAKPAPSGTKSSGDKQKSPDKPTKPALTKALMNPETHALIKAEFKRRLDAPYGKLYRALDLDSGTLQKLRGLLADKELALAEGYRLAAEAGIPLSTGSLAALRDEADGPIRELLGDAAHASYKYYESTLPARNHVNDLEERLSYRSEPLSSEQYDALVSALSALPDPNISPDSGAWLGNYSPDVTKGSLEKAMNILTPSQFAAYQETYEMRMLDQEIEKKYSQYLSPPKRNGKNNKQKK